MRSEKNRILIIGGNSFVGSTIARSLASECEIFCTYQNEFTREKNITYIQYSRLDDKDNAKTLVKNVNPDAIIYAAGTNNLAFTELDHNLRATQMMHSAGASNF